MDEQLPSYIKRRYGEQESPGKKILKERARIHEEGLALTDEVFESLEQLEEIWARWTELRQADRDTQHQLSLQSLAYRRPLNPFAQAVGLSGGLMSKIDDVLRAYRLVRGAKMRRDREIAEAQVKKSLEGLQ